MSSPPFFSAIIATYNNKNRTLHRAILSIVRQTCQDFEIIVVDDGTTNQQALESLEQLHSEFQAVCRLQVFRQANAGPGAARNFGAQKASGEWLAFLDDDDEWVPSKLETLKQVIAKDQPDFVYTGMEFVDENGNHIRNRRPLAPAQLPEVVRHNCLVVPSVMATRRSYFIRIGGFMTDLMGAEDWALNATVARNYAHREAKVAAIDSLDTRYYVLPTALSSTKRWKNLLRSEWRLISRKGLLDFDLTGWAWWRWWLRRTSDTLYSAGIGARESGNRWSGLALLGAAAVLFPVRGKAFRALAATSFHLAGLRGPAS